MDRGTGEGGRRERGAPRRRTALSVLSHRSKQEKTKMWATSRAFPDSHSKLNAGEWDRVYLAGPLSPCLVFTKHVRRIS